MRLIGEFFILIYLRLRVFLFQLREEWRVRRLFYKDPTFRLQDLAFLKTKNPYREKKAYPYGETPLTVGKVMADRFGLCSQDRFVDLGCGRGRLCSFFAFYKGCSVWGIDWSEAFVHQAQGLTTNLDRIRFSCADFREVDLTSASFIYLYGTCLNDADWNAVTENFAKAQGGTKVVTVSAPLEHPSFTAADQIEVVFPWGKGDLFLNIKK